MTAATFTAEDNLDLVFQALANRTRRALLAQLKRGPSMVTELAKPFGMSLNAISKHLTVLERAGLIKRAIEGRVHSCALEATPMASAEQWLSSYQVFWDDNLDSFAAFMESGQDQEQ